MTHRSKINAIYKISDSQWRTFKSYLSCLFYMKSLNTANLIYLYDIVSKMITVYMEFKQ